MNRGPSFSEVGARSHILGVRMSPGEKQQFKRMAQVRGLSESDFLRLLIKEYTKPDPARIGPGLIYIGLDS